MKNRAGLALLVGLGLAGCGEATPTTTPTATGKAPATQSLAPPTFSVTQTLTGANYTSSIPGSWNVSYSNGAGEITSESVWSLGTAPANAVTNIPPAGVISLTITETPVAQLPSGIGDVDQAPDHLLSVLVGVPTGATKPETIAPAAALSVGGSTGAMLSQRFTYVGTTNIQEDVVVHHARTVDVIELNCQPAMQASGEAALKLMIDSWKWS